MKLCAHARQGNKLTFMSNSDPWLFDLSALQKYDNWPLGSFMRKERPLTSAEIISTEAAIISSSFLSSKANLSVQPSSPTNEMHKSDDGKSVRFKCPLWQKKENEGVLSTHMKNLKTGKIYLKFETFIDNRWINNVATSKNVWSSKNQKFKSFYY